MTKIFVPVLFILSISNTCNQQMKENVEISFVIDTLVNSGISNWYQIQKQFINEDCTKEKKYASAYLCINKFTKDTIWIISPCIKNTYKQSATAALFIDDNVKIGDTVFINIPKEYSTNIYRQKRLYGTLKIPTD